MMRRWASNLWMVVLSWSLLSRNTNSQVQAEGFVFTDKLLQWTVVSVRLSLVAYKGDRTILEDFALQIYQDNPDQAVVAKIQGVCYAAFRGTEFFNWRDLFQNLKLGNREICAHGDCCKVERGFYDGYHTNYKDALEERMRNCVLSCGDKPCPVVLTGHSQGGAIASVAALYLADLDPTLITFGQMAAIDKPCTLINSEKYYRFENSRNGIFGPTYDPIPNLPYFASHFGHQIMLGDDSTGVAHIGKDTHTHFRPYDTDQAFRTHRLIPRRVGYVNRIENLAGSYEPSIRPTTTINDTAYDCYVKNGYTFGDHTTATKTSEQNSTFSEVSSFTNNSEVVVGKEDVNQTSSVILGGHSTLFNATETNGSRPVDKAESLVPLEAADSVVDSNETAAETASDGVDVLETIRRSNGSLTNGIESSESAVFSNEETTANLTVIVDDKVPSDVPQSNVSITTPEAPKVGTEVPSNSTTTKTKAAVDATTVVSIRAGVGALQDTGTLSAQKDEGGPKFIVRSNGFVDDSRCSKTLECVSRYCKRKRCRPPPS